MIVGAPLRSPLAGVQTMLSGSPEVYRRRDASACRRVFAIVPSSFLSGT